MASTKISLFEKKFYIGIDVHKETYSVACICEGKFVKKVSSVPANPAEFAQSVVHWFKGAEISSAYESGFSGFNLHRELEKAGIKSIVINADSIAVAVAVAANDKVKTDLRDSKKIAEQLSNSQLKSIYIPSKAEEAKRTLTRT